LSAPPASSASWFFLFNLSNISRCSITLPLHHHYNYLHTFTNEPTKNQPDKIYTNIMRHFNVLKTP
jgi:hypothetical protein